MRLQTGSRLFAVARGATEVLWLLALAGFVLHATTGRPFPLLKGLFVFVAAVIVSRLSLGRGWRRVSILVLHLLGLCGCMALTVPEALKASWWAPGGDWREWAWAGQAAFWAGVLWLKGGAFARNPASHERIGSQFDKGVTAFGLILLSGLFLEFKWGLSIAWMGTLPLFFLFFGLSMIAMAVATPEAPEGVLVEAIPGSGAGLAFAFLVAGIGTGIILLLMPVLMQGAQVGYDALKTTTSPLGPILVRILRFIFAHRRAPSASEGGSAGPGGVEMQLPEAGHEAGLLEVVLGWGLTGLLVAILVAGTAVALFFAIKALLARTGTRPESRRPGLWGWLREWIVRLQGLLGALSPMAWFRALLDPDPIRLYGRLSTWGARSGLPRRPSETPLEYGGRLSRRFEWLSPEIGRIVNLVNREVYSEAAPGPDLRAGGRRAWRRLRSPRQWPYRVRALLLPRRPLRRSPGAEQVRDGGPSPAY